MLKRKSELTNKVEHPAFVKILQPLTDRFPIYYTCPISALIPILRSNAHLREADNIKTISRTFRIISDYKG